MAHRITIAIAFVVAFAGALHAQDAVVQLTSNGARNGQAFFSPDGRWISFVSNQSGSWQIWLMAPDGGHARQLTHSTGPVGWPSWDIDGRSVQFYVQTASGYRLRKIEIASGEEDSVYDDGAQDFRPHMSPDGRRLLFDRAIGTESNHDIFVRDLESGMLQRLTVDPAYDSDARWSPDGTRIVFHSDRGAEPFATQIYIMNQDGTDVLRLTEGPAVHAYPAWSPDGQHVAYTSEINGNREIWVMKPGSDIRVQVTRHPGFDGDPVWSPTGTQLLFTTDRFGGQELVLVEIASLLESGPDARHSF